ncbi:MAG: polysaccharide deacetylase family protein [Clostridia bacterium]|nr:polysaccharide deacetylase family protein [Clostridia bacterium]
MPFCVIKRRTIKIICAFILVAVALAISYQGGASALVWFGQSSRLVPIYNVDTEKKQVAISFDAAWGADKTEQIIEVLAEYNAKATFFLVGFWVDKFPEMVSTIDKAGLEIGTHSNTHPDMAKLSEESVRSELCLSMDKIKAITGKDVRVFRPPFGSYNNMLLSVCSHLNLKAIQWDVDSLDWKGLSAGEVCKRVMNKAKNGSIILMHNNADNVVESTRLTLDWLTKAGYEVTSVGELIYWDDYHIDAAGMQHKN